jgi:hypothetical protein
MKRRSAAPTTALSFSNRLLFTTAPSFLSSRSKPRDLRFALPATNLGWKHSSSPCHPEAYPLAESIAVQIPEIYEAGHLLTQRTPHLMSRVILRMEAWPWMRKRSIGDCLPRHAPALGVRASGIKGEGH